MNGYNGMQKESRDVELKAHLCVFGVPRIH